jgi:hypothetical protein
VIFFERKDQLIASIKKSPAEDLILPIPKKAGGKKRFYASLKAELFHDPPRNPYQALTKRVFFLQMKNKSFPLYGRNTTFNQSVASENCYGWLQMADFTSAKIR